MNQEILQKTLELIEVFEDFTDNEYVNDWKLSDLRGLIEQELEY